MKLLDVVNINDCERIFECNSTRTYYKMENNELLFRKENSKGWARSIMTVGRLREYDVEETQEEIQEGRKKSRGEIYYYIDEMGNVIEDTEEFASLDDDRYEFGNYFENKEDAEMCRDFIKKTIKDFKNNNDNKQKSEEEFKKEFDKIKKMNLVKKHYGELSISSNYLELDSFKGNDDCIYLELNDEYTGLSFSDWDSLNQYVEKLRSFK